jgi:copper chaperone
MGTLQFKTNIKCDGCIKKVTPFMNADLRIVQWSVDTANPEKILTVRVEQMADEEVMNLLGKAGFRAEAVMP